MVSSVAPGASLSTNVSLWDCGAKLFFVYAVYHLSIMSWQSFTSLTCIFALREEQFILVVDDNHLGFLKYLTYSMELSIVKLRCYSCMDHQNLKKSPFRVCLLAKEASLRSPLKNDSTY